MVCNFEKNHSLGPAANIQFSDNLPKKMAKQERKTTIQKELFAAGNRHIITRTIITQDCSVD